jgi:uroporphyrinogen decarboxylase
MKPETMTPLQRVLTTLVQKEPDRVPLFLPVTMHGAKELGMTIREYFSRAENVAEGQLRLREKYRQDFFYAFFYGPVDVEAWGGEVVYRDDGPPNSGTPLIRNPEDITVLAPPRVADSPCLIKVLKAIELLKSRGGPDVPIVGVVMSPFSLPVMQMGFENYLKLIYERPALFSRLMEANTAFCIEWANAQLSAGATAICYFDPVSSSTIVPRETYLKTGFEVARRTLAGIQGPTATHMASGRCASILSDLAQTGTAIVGGSVLEDLAELKAISAGKLTILGNLNGIEMRRWTSDQSASKVKDALAAAGPGGGFILGDNHGEIPWQVPEDVLLAISETVNEWGRYPLDWTSAYEK